MKVFHVMSAAAVFFTVLFEGCGGTIVVDTSKLPDTYQCRQMNDVCKESSEFERTYSKLSGDEKKDAEAILKAYRIQCSDALDACRASGKVKK